MQDKYAIVFPGQGSQVVGMLRGLASEHPEVQATFCEASEELTYDLWDLSQNGPKERLNLTEYTQPALLAAGVAVWRIWSSKSKTRPSFLAGHSLGEYTALVCSEAIAFREAIKIVEARGRFMQTAFSGKGAMVAIVGLADDIVEKICGEARRKGVLVAANYNSIGQIVLSGEFDAANRAVEIAKKAGAKVAKILPVSVPSHSVLMKPASEKLSEMLGQVAINPPKIPVIHNADVTSYSDPLKIRDVLTRQLYSPVRWVETVQFFVDQGIKYVLECGPGKVLTGLNKRISSVVTVDFIGDSQKMLNYL